MKIGREFGFIAMNMRIKKPMDMTALTINTHFEVGGENLQVEATGRQSPHHALFMNKRTNRQRLAMKYDPPATAAIALSG
jgi:hypothetical protein